MAERYRKNYVVSWSDMDVNYHMTKIAAAKFFQETFALMCSKHNLAAFDVCEQNIAWVIADLHIDFSGEMPYWSESFSVEIWISEKSKLRTYCDFEIIYKDKVIAKGDSCWYLLDMNSRRPMKSIDVVAPFELIEEKVFLTHEKYDFKFEGEKIAQKTHNVTVRDLDFNFHVNNLSYVGLVLETMPADFLDKYSVYSCRVKFVQEAHIEDKLVCEVFQSEEVISSRIYKESDNSDVCYLFSKCEPKGEVGRNPREAGVVFV